MEMGEMGEMEKVETEVSLEAPVKKTSLFSGKGWWNDSLAKTVEEKEKQKEDRIEKEEQERKKQEQLVLIEIEQQQQQEKEEQEQKEQEKEKLQIAQTQPVTKKKATTAKTMKKKRKGPPKKTPLKKKPATKKLKKVVVSDSSSSESDSESSSEEEDTDSDSEDSSSSSSSASSSSSSSSSASSSSAAETSGAETSDTDNEDESKIKKKKRGAPSLQMKALKNELMQELKKSRDEAQQLRQTVEEQQKQFGAQQDIITRQQAQIQGLIVAKEAAEVARQKQEINLIEAKRETEKAIDDGKEKEKKALRLAQLVESRRKEANEEARLLRKRAAQLLTGASLSTGAAFYEAMQRRKQLERDTGVAKAVDDLDDLIEALQTDDIESGISRPTTAREAGDEYDSEEDEAVEHAALVGRGGSGEEEEEAEEEEEEAEAGEEAEKAEKDAAVGNIKSIKKKKVATKEEDLSEDYTTEEEEVEIEEEIEEDVLDGNGVVIGKKKSKRKKLVTRTRKKKRKKKKTALNAIPDGGLMTEGAKKKIRSKLNTSGGQIKRGSGFQMPKHHVRQFRHPREMEMLLMEREKTIDDLTIKLEKTTDVLHFTQSELHKLKDVSESGAQSARESGAEVEDDEGHVLYNADGLPTAHRQTQVQLVLDNITKEVGKTLNKVGYTPRKGGERGGRDGSGDRGMDGGRDGGDKKEDDGESKGMKLLEGEEAMQYERQLEKWVEEKLDKWEQDGKFRKKRKKKYKNKENFAKYLRDKTKDQLKAATVQQ